MDQTDHISEMGEMPELKGETIDENISAQEVNITHGGVHHVRGINVTLRQAGAHTVNAEQLTIRQGGAVKVEADHLEMTQGGLVAAKTKTANLRTSPGHSGRSRGGCPSRPERGPGFSGQGGCGHGSERGGGDGCPKCQSRTFRGYLPDRPGGVGGHPGHLRPPRVSYLRGGGRHCYRLDPVSVPPAAPGPIN